MNATHHVPACAAPAPRRAAFTIVELMVVVAIIALLISIAVPSFNRARIQAKVVASRATISAISAGLELFRSEQSLGNAYPPSASDDPSGLIRDPYHGTQTVRVSGASLLALALAGPDNKGTAGFRGQLGGTWASTTGGPGSTPPGLYASTSTPRFGPYAEGKLMEKLLPILGRNFGNEVYGLEKMGVVRWSDLASDDEKEQRFFVDEFNRPILYYRARPAARNVITNPNGGVGIYDQRDNALFTGGTLPGSPAVSRKGVLFVRESMRQGFDPSSPPQLRMHDLMFTRYDFPVLDPDFGKPLPADPNLPPVVYPFDANILDKKSTVLPTPVNAQTFLLISPGPDGFYGTKDDVKNWGE